MRFGILSLLFFWTLPLFGQFTLTGTILNGNQEAVGFSNVLILNEKDVLVKGSVADLHGQFSISNLPEGNYKLKVTAISYQDFEQQLQLDEHLDLHPITLTSDAVALDELTVTAQKVAYTLLPDRTVVNVASLPTAAGGNALELLEKSPSVQLDRINGKIALLGRDDVIVTINGKRTRLDGNDLIQYLSTLPAANIESIELINNPPASFDAEGTGGVINIVIKNYEANGLNGTVNLYTGYGERAKYGGTASFHFKQQQLNVYGDASTSQDYTNQNSDILSSIQFTEGLLGSEQYSLRPAYIGNYHAKLGFAYAFTSKTNIDVFGAFARRRWELEAETATNYSGDLLNIRRDFLTSDETNTSNQYTFSSRINHQFSTDHKLSLDYDYLNFNIVNPTGYTLQNFDATDALISQEAFDSFKETPFDFQVARLDYTGGFLPNWKVETGLKMTLSQVQNNTGLLNATGQLEEDNLFTDQIVLDEQIYAAYVSLDGQLYQRLRFSGGLRYEYSALDLQTKETTIDRQISRLFPSLSLSQQFSEMSRLTLAYRERISRPGFQNLAPAFFFLNAFTVLTGNVQAQPNINRTFELTWNHKSLFVALSYSRDNNPIAFFIQTLENDSENLLFIAANNFRNRRQVGLNLGFPITFNRIWSSRYSFGSYWRKDEIEYPEEILIKAHPFFNVDLTQTVQLNKNWSFELSGKWNSRVYRAILAQRGQLQLNLGVQKKWKASSIGLSWTDMLNSGSFFGFQADLPSQGIEYDWNYDLEGSIVRLSYTYNIGAKPNKKGRNSGATEVINRVNQ
ncbi:MAG: outer membrane beta-barrel protein [Bacteroidota bacterium]